MNAMLASVRDCVEASIALAGGCDWLDIKEPAAGALGRVATKTVEAIVQLAARRVPVSATIGDSWDSPELIAPAVMAMAATGVDYVKVGVNAREVDALTLAALRAAIDGKRAVIAVCMAERPPARRDLAALAACGLRGVMLDTMDKQGPSLPGLMSLHELREFVDEAHRLGLLAGLAGRLQREDIASLRSCGADYLGFRSALCAAGERRAALDPEAFHDLRSALSAAPASTSNHTSEVT